MATKTQLQLKLGYHYFENGETEWGAKDVAFNCWRNYDFVLLSCYEGLWWITIRVSVSEDNEAKLSNLMQFCKAHDTIHLKHDDIGL